MKRATKKRKFKTKGIERLPMLQAFCSLYSTVSVDELERCCDAMLTGKGLRKVSADKGLKWVRLLFTTAMETETICDNFLRLSRDDQLNYPINGLSDYTLLTLSSVFYESMRPKEYSTLYNNRYNELVLAVLNSETASPMIDYEWMSRDFVEYGTDDTMNIDYLWVLKCSLAHNIAHNNGNRFFSILSHIASVYLDYNNFEEAIRLHAAAIENDYKNTENIYFLISDLAKMKYYKEAVSVARKSVFRFGAESFYGLSFHIDCWTKLISNEDSLEVDPEIHSMIENAIHSSKATNIAPLDLAQILIPQFNEIPVKKPIMQVT